MDLDSIVHIGFMSTRELLICLIFVFIFLFPAFCFLILFISLLFLCLVQYFFLMLINQHQELLWVCFAIYFCIVIWFDWLSIFSKKKLGEVDNRQPAIVIGYGFVRDQRNFHRQYFLFFLTKSQQPSIFNRNVSNILVMLSSIIIFFLELFVCNANSAI